MAFAMWDLDSLYYVAARDGIAEVVKKDGFRPRTRHYVRASKNA